MLVAVALVGGMLVLGGCGGGKGGSSSGPGSTTKANGIDLTHAPAGTQVVGPNLNGSSWKGFLETAAGRFPITAVVRHIGRGVVIRTDRTGGQAQEFIGSISSGGSMSMLDTFTNQTWTTLKGPASSRRIRLFDFTFEGNHKGKTNVLDISQ